MAEEEKEYSTVWEEEAPCRSCENAGRPSMKPASAFNKDPRRVLRLKAVCKECELERSRNSMRGIRAYQKKALAKARWKTAPAIEQEPDILVWCTAHERVEEMCWMARSTVHPSKKWGLAGYCKEAVQARNAKVAEARRGFL